MPTLAEYAGPYMSGLQLGAHIGMAAADRNLEQQKLDRLTEQTRLAQQIQERKTQLDEAEAARTAEIFRQQLDFANRVRAYDQQNPAPGGGDFTAMTPEDQGSALDEFARRRAGALTPFLPATVAPTELMKQTDIASRERIAQARIDAQEKLAEQHNRDIADRLNLNNQLILGRIPVQTAAQLGKETGIPTITPGGTVDSDAVARANAAKQDIVENRKKTAIEKRADEFTKSVKSLNPSITDAELADAKDAFVASNGKSAVIPDSEIKTITAGDTLATGLQRALDDVKAFNAKFGKNAFDQFTGPIDSRIFNLRKKYGKQFTDADAIAARQIFQEIDQVSQAYRVSNFGTALTQSEQNEFKKIIESPDSASFLPAIEGAVKSTKRILENKLSLYPYAQNVTPEMRARYGGGTSAAPKRVSSREEYNALPSGALFIDDSGNVKKKK